MTVRQWFRQLRAADWAADRTEVTAFVQQHAPGDPPPTSVYLAHGDLVIYFDRAAVAQWEQIERMRWTLRRYFDTWDGSCAGVTDVQGNWYAADSEY